jgi:DNA-binding response OmpR family regulator
MKPLRILLVDDDALIGTLLAEMLDQMGHVVCGIEATEVGAVQAALRDKPDLMIVDARLRDGDGVTAVETILRTASIPHIIMSGARLPGRRAPAVKLQKPFMYRDLASAIERATGWTGAALA